MYLESIGKEHVAVNRLIDYFGPLVRVDEIDPFTKLQCVSDLKKASWEAEDTPRRSLGVALSAVTRYALGLRPQPRATIVRERILTLEEIERLIRVAQHPPSSVRDPHRRLLKMTVFMFGSGATPGEMFCVRAEDLHPGSGEVWIRGVEPGGGKTPYRGRMVHLPPRAWELMGELPSRGKVFLTTTGKEVNPDPRGGNRYKLDQFHKLCAAAGLEEEEGGEGLCYYSFRHTWATFFSAQVGNHDLLIDQGGWANAAMARRYRKRPPADLADRLFGHGWDFRP